MSKEIEAARKTIADYIAECEYTYSVDDIIHEYIKYKSGSYTSFTATQTIKACEKALEVIVLSALRAQLERSNPKPLTLEELDVRDAPVYTPLSDGTGFWCLCQNGWIIPPSCMCFAARERREWTFYDHKPEEGDK